MAVKFYNLDTIISVGYRVKSYRGVQFRKWATVDIEVYKLTDDQRKAIHEARQQIKNGQFLTDEQANKEIDEWLNKHGL